MNIFFWFCLLEFYLMKTGYVDHSTKTLILLFIGGFIYNLFTNAEADRKRRETRK